MSPTDLVLVWIFGMFSGFFILNLFVNYATSGIRKYSYEVNVATPEVLPPSAVLPSSESYEPEDNFV